MSVTVANAGASLGNCRIAYTNRGQGISPTVTSESSGYEATRALNWTSHDRWVAANSALQNLDLDLGNAQSVDCFGLYKHNLGDIAGSIIVSYSTTSAGGAYSSLFALTPGVTNSGGNRTLFRINSNAVSAQWWRFTFSGHNAAPQVGVAFLGESVRLPPPQHPFTPPIVGRETEVLNNQSEAGEFIGRSILRQGMRTGLKYARMNDAMWIRDVWEPLLRAVEVNPFFFAWDATRYPNEAYYCYTDKKLRASESEKPAHMKVELTFYAK